MADRLFQCFSNFVHRSARTSIELYLLRLGTERQEKPWLGKQTDGRTDGGGG